jgi:hypothetical protein
VIGNYKGINMTDLSLSYDFQNKNQDYKAISKKQFENTKKLIEKDPSFARQMLIDIGMLNSDGSKSKNYYPDGH